MIRVALSLLALVLWGAPAWGAGEEEDPAPSDDRFFVVILSDAERTEYNALSPEDTQEWRRRYWAERDPTPTTDENQREREHQKRVLETIRRFRDKKDRFVFDDRAHALIRFGEPERVESIPGEVVIHGGMIAPHEFWLYNDMILWFEDRWLNGHFEAGLTKLVSSIGDRDQGLREDTGWKEDEKLLFEESFNRFLVVNDVEVDPTRARQMTDTGLHRWEELPEINNYDYSGGKEFRFFFDVSHLAGEEGQTDLLVGFLVPMEEFVFAKEEGAETAKLQRRAALFDPDYQMVERKVESFEHSIDPALGKPGWIVTCDSFSVPPGSYNLALRMLDLRSHNHGIMKTLVEAPNYDGDEIRISDIVFAGSVTREPESPGAYMRGDYRIVPRPIRIYAPGEDVQIYFEVYHITTGEGGRGLFEVEYTLFGTKSGRFISFFGGSSEGKLESGIGQSFRSYSNGSMVRRQISLNTSALPEDRYTLIVSVLDMANQKSDDVNAQFVIKR